MDEHAKKIVSYGFACGDVLLPGSFDIEFEDNILKNYCSIDERNLTMCEFLNLWGASITSFNAREMTKLIVLVLYGCKINALITDNLQSIEYLSITDTDIEHINTEPLENL